MAKQMNMTVSALSKGFKRDTGSTLKEYMYQKKIEKAKEKLLLTDLNIKEIAHSLGFEEEFFF